MEVEFRLTKEDYLGFIRYYVFQRRLVYKILWLAFICYFASMRVQGVAPTTQTIICRFAFLLPVGLLLIFVAPYVWMRYKFRQSVSKNPLVFSSQKVWLEDDGIHRLRDEGTDTLSRYDAISFVEMTPGYIFYSIPYLGYSIIPVSAFKTSSDAINFFGKVRGEFLRANGRAKRLRRLYYWGLLCLVPNFGAICGIVLIIRGLTEFRDRKLVLIGIGGFAVTALFITTFKYEIEHGDMFKNAHMMQAQTEMNTIVKQIEFYRMQNGTYPDSLQQVNKQEMMTSIYDPFVFDGEKRKIRTFRFQNLGNKYTLFSVGPNGLPNTMDDVYPNLKINDASKCGLVINRAGQ